MQKRIVITVKWYSHQTTLQGFIDAIKQLLNYTRTLIPSDMQSNAKVDVCVLLVVLRGCQSTKKRPVFLPRTLVIFFSSCHVIAKWNLIHVNDFGCLACDLNLPVFSMVIFLSTFKRRLLSCFISEKASNLAKVAILALYCRYALANFQWKYICSVESILSLTLDPEWNLLQLLSGWISSASCEDNCLFTLRPVVTSHQ